MHFFFAKKKTTTTNYRRANVDGVVQMNNIPLGSKKYSKLCSYILQEDNLYPGFTVYESMLLAANLKIADISHAEKNIIVSVCIFFSVIPSSL